MKLGYRHRLRRRSENSAEINQKVTQLQTDWEHMKNSFPNGPTRRFIINTPKSTNCSSRVIYQARSRDTSQNLGERLIKKRRNSQEELSKAINIAYGVSSVLSKPVVSQRPKRVQNKYV